MTKKDYDAIAQAIADNTPQTQGTHLAEQVSNDIARAIADHCAADSAKFNRERFLKACGVQS